MTNEIDPSASMLLLTDWESDPLTVADIVASKLENCQLAYLSACHAASNRVEDLFDEGIHLAAACQLAGVPHVIGTLWRIDDCLSAKVAQRVYNAMSNGLEGIDFGKAAEALHFAIRRTKNETIRESEVALDWVPYIHIGA